MRLLDGWNVFFVEETPGIRALLARIDPKIPIYDSPTPIARMLRDVRQFAPALSCFRKVFASYEIGPAQAGGTGVGPRRRRDWRAAFCPSATRSAISRPRACGLQAVHVRSG
jgi:hypothetical protein